MVCAPVGCIVNTISESFGPSGSAVLHVNKTVAPVGTNATVTCNTGYYLRVDGDGGGMTTCSDTCLLALPKCQPVQCVGAGVMPVGNASETQGRVNFTHPET